MHRRHQGCRSGPVLDFHAVLSGYIRECDVGALFNDNGDSLLHQAHSDVCRRRTVNQNGVEDSPVLSLRRPGPFVYEG